MPRARSHGLPYARKAWSTQGEGRFRGNVRQACVRRVSFVGRQVRGRRKPYREEFLSHGRLAFPRKCVDSARIASLKAAIEPRGFLRKMRQPRLDSVQALLLAMWQSGRFFGQNAV